MNGTSVKMICPKANKCSIKTCHHKKSHLRVTKGYFTRCDFDRAFLKNAHINCLAPYDSCIPYVEKEIKATESPVKESEVCPECDKCLHTDDCDEKFLNSEQNPCKEFCLKEKPAQPQEVGEEEKLNEALDFLSDSVIGYVEALDKKEMTVDFFNEKVKQRKETIKLEIQFLVTQAVEKERERIKEYLKKANNTAKSYRDFLDSVEKIGLL